MDLSISVPSHTSRATRVLTHSMSSTHQRSDVSQPLKFSMSPKCACYLLQESSQSWGSNSPSVASLIPNTGTWVSFLTVSFLTAFPAVSSTDNQVLLISFPKHSSMYPLSFVWTLLQGSLWHLFFGLQPHRCLLSLESQGFLNPPLR